MKNERKEELKDEMKNRISMALKDPILQQGFEIICKENEELKMSLKVERQNKSNVFAELNDETAQSNEMLMNEVAELERKLEQAEKDLADYQFNYPTIKELQKENAELKSRDCWKGCLYASGKSELIHEFLQQKYNLTKAKDLLAKWVELFNPKLEGFPKTPIQVDTEKFLKEQEK